MQLLSFWAVNLVIVWCRDAANVSTRDLQNYCILLSIDLELEDFWVVFF